MSAPTLRRGLPREPGGDAWPPEGVYTPPAPSSPPAAPAASAAATASPVGAATVAESPAVAPAPGATTEQPLRRGLPRVPGGEPWPEVAVAHVTAATAGVAGAAAAEAAAASVALPTAAQPVAASTGTPATTTMVDQPLRRGLPRVPGGEPWPEVAVTQVAAAVQEAAPEPAAPEAATRTEPAATQAAPAQPAAKKPAPKKQAKTPAKSTPAAEKQTPSWLGKAIGAGIGALILLAIAIFAARAFVAGPGADFIAQYDGVAPTPESTPIGLPAWMGWSHFFNFFLMTLIIRSGLQIRGERKPPAYFAPKKDPSKKVSLTVWLHTSLDVLWLVNGLIFVVLLFATGQWMRIVPTSWEIFPNMASAAIQYLSMDWPAENGWIHYNALQQMAYFVTVFIAAPLAAATGFRMSNWWPKDNKALSNAYPVELARKLHYPTMIYFVLFIIGHVFLVFATGAKKNLGHMFAASPDAGWWGVIWFLVALLVTAGAWFAAKPMILAPIARVFGNVTNR